MAYAQNDSAKYLSLCRQYGVVSGKDGAGTEAAYEMRGVISGIAESGEGYNLLLQQADGTTVSLVGAGAAPAFNVGSRVRALIRGGSSVNAAGDVSLLAIASEGEVAIDQASRQEKQDRPVAGRAGAYPSGFKKSSPLKKRNISSLTSRAMTRPRPINPVAANETLSAYKRAIRYFNKTGSEQEIDTIARAVLNYSIKYQVDARLVMAIFAVESNFKPTATSGAGAAGIGQLMPGTASGLGVSNAYDPEQNIEGSIKYIREQLDRYQGKDEWTRLQLVLASYNAGPGAVQKYGGVPPYRETQAYVKRVSSWFFHFLGK
jgi:soluble lytic murein transglycosylase-like protein